MSRLPNRLPRTKMTPTAESKREAAFWRDMRKSANDLRKSKTRNLTLTRIETWAMPGVPDVHVMSEDGAFHWIELKIANFAAVELSPHQCAWLSRHAKGSAWIVVYYDRPHGEPDFVYVYHASDAVDVRMMGLKHPCRKLFQEPFDWAEIWGLIAPSGSHSIADTEATTEEKTCLP